MAYTTPTTASGQVLTSAIWNASVRDNLEYVYSAGANRPRGEVTHNATQSIANNTATALAFTTENVDAFGLHSTSINTSRITIPSGWGGWWFLIGWCEFAANATGQRGAYLRVNGTTSYGVILHDAAAAGTTYVPVSALIRLSVADYVEFIVLQTSGGALNVSAGPLLQAVWMTLAG